MGADFSNRRRPCLDERVDIVERRCRVVFVVNFIFSGNKIQNPVGKCLAPYSMEKRGKFEVGVCVDQSRHQKGILQVKDLLIRELSHDVTQ